MFIEDLLHRLTGTGIYMFEIPVKMQTRDVTLMSSVANQVSQGLGLTERQRSIVLVMLNKYRAELAIALQQDITPFLSNPQFKQPSRTLSQDKKIQVSTAADNLKRISVYFPYNENIINTIKEYKKTQTAFDSQEIAWDATNRCWNFGFTEPNVLFLSGLVEDGFAADDVFIEAVELIKEIESNIESYIPMVVFDDGKFVFKNTVSKIPQPGSTDLVDVLFDARRYGITCWDDAIDIALKEINPVTKDFLSNTGTLNISSSSLDSIQDIIDCSKSTIFVIPGGTELDHLICVHKFLTAMGYSNEHISVMFRLDSGSGRLCNEYIKDNKLNTPVAQDTKFVFVSGKIPKPF